MKKFKLVVSSFAAIIFCMLLIAGSIDSGNYAGDYYFKAQTSTLLIFNKYSVTRVTFSYPVMLHSI